MERSEISLNTALQRPVQTENKSIRPIFEKGGVKYYAEIPTPPSEKPRQTVLSLREPGIREWVNAALTAYNKQHPDKPKKLGWQTTDGGRLRNEKMGSYDHSVAVKYDEKGNLTDVLYDLVNVADGPVDPKTGLATPGAVVVPIEKVKVNGKDQYFVHAFWQYRPAPYDNNIKVPAGITPEQARDFVALNRGMWLMTTPGGFADTVGESPESVAKREAMEEAGIRILGKPTFEQQSFNRANYSTLVNVGFCVFERTGGALSEEAEKIVGNGKIAIRIDKFKTSDAMVGAGIQVAREKLGLISASTKSAHALAA